MVVTDEKIAFAYLNTETQMFLLFCYYLNPSVIRDRSNKPFPGFSKHVVIGQLKVCRGKSTV